MTQDEIMETIREWQRHWRFSEPGYFERASGIDANMRHDLVRRILDFQSSALITPLQAMKERK